MEAAEPVLLSETYVHYTMSIVSGLFIDWSINSQIFQKLNIKFAVYVKELQIFNWKTTIFHSFLDVT